MFDLTYSQLLDTNQELRGELQDEIFINKSNEKKIRSLVKELEQCYRTISIQDNTIIAHEKEIEKLKSEISDLRKQLRVLQQDKKFKDEVRSIQDGRIIELENKVGSLKARIWILIDKKISINALDMATTNLIANVNRGLDRIENHIRGVGTPMQNPANVIDDESRVRVERTVRERDNAQGERDLAMLAYNNERQESCRWMFSYQDKDRRIQELLREKFAKQLLYQRNTNRLQQNTRQLQTNAQNQGQILALQNNPLGNMADARRLPVLNLIAPILAKNKPYTGQEPPDDYLDRLIQSISFAQGHMTVLENANAGDFDDAVKCDIYKAQMGGKYLPVPAQDPYNGNANINTPATLRAWMRSHYQRETVGSRQSALQRLTQEKFLPTDSPDTYEKRIRPLLLGVADGDAQTVGFLKNHLSGDLYTWMRAVTPAAEIDKLNSKIASLEAQLVQPIQAQPQNNDALEKMYIRAVRLGMPVDAPKDLTSLDNYINDELIRRLGVNNTNYTKLSKKYSQMVNVVKKLAKHKCSNCGKTGHNSRKCPRKKKSKSKKGKVNLATLDSDSGSDTNSDMLSDDSSDSGKKKVKKESSNPSSSLKKKSKSRLTAKSQEVTDIETAFFSKKKKRSSESLSQDNQSRLENIIEKIIEKVLNEKFGDIIAFFQSQNSASRILIDGKDDSTSDTPETPDSGGEDEILNEPMEIDFVQKKDPATDVVTTKCKIKHLVIPGAIVDPGANFLIMTDDISKRSKLEIDTKEKHDLRGIATTPTESLGIVRNVPVNFAPGCTIYADFAVVKYPKPMLILPNTLLDKYNYDLLASKRELRLECNGKEFFIPINMHKVKNKLEVNCATTTSKCDESSTPDCILQDLSEDDDVLKKK
ncbi:hypothetical protein GLOIN_2v1773489 [Rhizophagus irregularis DAOM 181602=DAOM 197198]|nr:hypothetical protein GLOIN_2v1773489 [Rhizophagus irregularis DAOM 181602=DAOM 197198]